MPRSPRAYPQPLCATCGASLACEGRGAAEASYPACRVPLRRVRLDRIQTLFEAWRLWDGIVAPEAVLHERALLTAFARDRERFSDIFEASFSIDERGAHAYRYSYAFPGWGTAPASAAQVALACAAPFGARVVAATKRLLRAATDGAVEQPLIGIAWDRDGAPRHKLYLQFRPAAGGAAAALAERVLALPGLAEQVGDASLHMLGVDFGPDGLIGAKLYVLHERLEVGEGTLPAGRFVRNALAIHRWAPADGVAGVAGGAAPEIDFALADNDLVWDELREMPRIASILQRSRVFPRLCESFRVGVRRVSISAGALPKISVYYGLSEVEEP